MSALGRKLGVSLSAMTQIADRLERADMVKRVAEDSDRRVALPAIDAAGREHHAAPRGGPHRAAHGGPGELSPRQRRRRCPLEVLLDACGAARSRQLPFTLSKAQSMRVIIVFLVALA